jgi:hypothetical protein
MAGVLLLFAASMSLIINIVEKKTTPQKSTEPDVKTSDA